MHEREGGDLHWSEVARHDGSWCAKTICRGQVSRLEPQVLNCLKIPWDGQYDFQLPAISTSFRAWE